MLQHVVLWSYASVWKPLAEAGRNGRTAERDAALDADDCPEAEAFATLMRKVHCGAAPQWWTMSERIGHG